MVVHSAPTNPIQSDYNTGVELINPRALRTYCDATNQTINNLVYAVNTMEQKDRVRYDRALRFIDWLATTNPKVLDEFKAVERALQYVGEGDDGGEVQAGPAA
jgi:ABC-type tungstate transport system permease subunit